MRTPTAIWVATLALLSAPLLITADAAPAPHAQRHQHPKRYLVPIRRRDDGASFVNSSPSIVADTPAPVESPKDTEPSPKAVVAEASPKDTDTTPKAVESDPPKAVESDPPKAAVSVAADAETTTTPKANKGSNLLGDIVDTVGGVVDDLTGGKSTPSTADAPAAKASSPPADDDTLLSNPLVVGLNTILSDIIPNTVPSETVAVEQPVETLLSNVIPSGVTNALTGNNEEHPAAVSSAPESIITPPPTVPLVGGLLDGVQGVASDLGAGLQNIASNVANVASDVGAGLATVVSDVGAGLATVASDIINPVASVVSDALDPKASGDLTDPLLNGVQSLVSEGVAIVTGITDPLVQSVVSNIVPIVTGLPDGVLAPVESLVSDLAPIVTGISDPLLNGVQSVVSNIVPIVTGLPDGVLAPVESLVSDVVPIVTGISDPLLNGVQSVLSDVVPIVTGLPDGVLAPIESLVSNVVPIVTGLPDGVLAPIESLVSNVVPIITGLPDIVESIVSNVIPIVTGLPDGVIPPIESIISELIPIVTGLPDGVIPPIESIVSELIPIVTGLPDGVIPPIESIVSNIIPIVTGVPDPVIAPVESIIEGFTAPVALPTGGVPLASDIAPIVAPLTNLPPQADPLPTIPGVAQPDPTGIVALVPSGPANPVPIVSDLAAIPGAVLPTGTDSETALALPSVILVNASPTATVALDNAPKVLQPPGGTPIKQPDETLVQIGFNKSLNYAFVSTTEKSASQIFTFLPLGMSHGLSLDADNVRIQSIQPYDTLKQMGYVTTLALIYIPTKEVDKLSVLLHTPTSDIYGDHGQTQVNALMPYINPAIPLLAGQTMGDGAIANAQAMPSQAPGSSTGASPFGPDSANTEPVRVQSATIATSSALAGVAFATAMVFVANRYRQRRRSSVHRRSSSLPNDPVWMSQARSHSNPSRNSRGSGNSNDRSVRSAEISAPVMAQNSLGWN